MAHFVSEVTRQKMDARREDASRTQSDTLSCVGDVLGYVRCAALSRRRADERQGEEAEEVWCGEQDGVIVVRRVNDGTPLRTIERKPQVFVFAMAGIANEVWAGLSDGFIRIFDATDARLLDEVKGHCAAVSALLPVTYIYGSTVARVVFSASTDWTIAKWDADSFTCLARFTGHTNAVRCLAHTSDGELLLSGSDDGTVRLWSALTHLELATTGEDAAVQQQQQQRGGEGELSDGNGAQWPVSTLSGPATAILVLDDRYALIATHMGAVTVHSLATGAFLRELEHRPCPVTTMVFDEVNRRVYIGGVDGVLTIYDGRMPLLAMLGAVHDHSGTYIAGHTKLRRESQLTLLALADDGSVSKHVNNGHLLSMQQAARLQHLQEGVDAHRDVVIGNFRELEVLRAELQRLEMVEGTRKQAMSERLGGGLVSKRDYLQRARHWLARRRVAQQAAQVAAWLEFIHSRRLAGRYTFKWTLFFKLAADLRRKRALSETLLATQAHSTAIRYSLMLHYAAVKAHARRQVLQAAERLFGVTSRGMMHVYYARWSKFRERRHADHVQQRVARLITTRIDHALLSDYWQRLVATARHQEVWGAKVRLLQSVGRMSARGLLIVYLAKWSDFVRLSTRARRIHEREMVTRADESTVESNQRLARRYLLIWKRFLAHQQAVREEAEERRIAAERAMWEELIESSSSTTRGAMQAEREALLRQMEDVKAQQRALDAEITVAQHANYDIQRDLSTTGAKLQLDPAMPLGAKLALIMEYLKARGVSCHADYVTIAAVKEAAQKGQRSAAASSASASASAVRAPPATARATTPRGSTKSAALSPPRTTPRGLTPAQVAAKELEAAVAAFRTRTHAAIEAIGYTIPKLQQQQDDWGITFHAIDRLRKKDAAEVMTHMKQIVIRYDVLCAHTTAPELAISETTATQFVLNSYVLLHLTQLEFERSALEYTKGVSPAHTSAVAAAALHEVRKDDGAATRLRHRGTSIKRAAPPVIASLAASQAGAATAATDPTTPTATAKAREAASPHAPSPRPASPRPTPRAAGGSTTPRPSATTPRATPRPPGQRASPKGSSSSSTPTGSGAPRPFMGFKVVYASAKKDALVISECSDDPAAPAALAGLCAGDRLLRFANFVVTDLPAFNAVVSRHVKVGATLPIQVSRVGIAAPLNLEITIATRAAVEASA